MGFTRELSIDSSLVHQADANRRGVKKIHVGVGENENLFMTLVSERRKLWLEKKI